MRYLSDEQQMEEDKLEQEPLTIQPIQPMDYEEPQLVFDQSVDIQEADEPQYSRKLRVTRSSTQSKTKGYGTRSAGTSRNASRNTSRTRKTNK